MFFWLLEVHIVNLCAERLGAGMITVRDLSLTRSRVK